MASLRVFSVLRRSLSQTAQKASTNASGKKVRKVDRLRESLNIVPLKDLSEEEQKKAKEKTQLFPAGIKPNQYRFQIPPELLEGVDESVKRSFEFQNASNSEVMHQRKWNLVEKLGAHEFDTGSTGVQIAILTEKIRNLAEHMRFHHGDIHSRRGLEAMLHRRRKLMWYLRRKDYPTYAKVIEACNIPDIPYPTRKPLH
eukprot:TRINITY_DN2278_c0_g5_i1.p1 TRINITY_DN2278_c0_g5~~TRINITY_DN2278_c0_g5_i1.p1  ORF type:complete len:217 (+),score=63.52 TRINITY_DN2278_c0_g5_i1:57-653(+)